MLIFVTDTLEQKRCLSLQMFNHRESRLDWHQKNASPRRVKPLCYRSIPINRPKQGSALTFYMKCSPLDTAYANQCQLTLWEEAKYQRS